MATLSAPPETASRTRRPPRWHSAVPARSRERKLLVLSDAFIELMRLSGLFCARNAAAHMRLLAAPGTPGAAADAPRENSGLACAAVHFDIRPHRVPQPISAIAKGPAAFASRGVISKTARLAALFYSIADTRCVHATGMPACYVSLARKCAASEWPQSGGDRRAVQLLPVDPLRLRSAPNDISPHAVCADARILRFRKSPMLGKLPSRTDSAGLPDLCRVRLRLASGCRPAKRHAMQTLSIRHICIFDNRLRSSVGRRITRTTAYTESRMRKSGNFWRIQSAHMPVSPTTFHGLS